MSHTRGGMGIFFLPFRPPPPPHPHTVPREVESAADNPNGPQLPTRPNRGYIGARACPTRSTVGRGSHIMGHRCRPDDQLLLGDVPQMEQSLQTELIRFPPLGLRSDSPVYELKPWESDNEESKREHRETYISSRLSEKQSRIFDWCLSKPKTIAVVQAGPGCGKSFVLATVANAHQNCDVIIYKHDLLNLFRYSARRNTVTCLGMKLFRCNYYRWQGLEKSISSNMSAFQFTLTFVGLLAAATLPNFGGGLVLIDEYTVISKPMLMILLTLLEQHRVGTLLCGDRNQLQNIYNSRHATHSAFNLVQMFTDTVFDLSENKRCPNKYYCEVMDFISTLSCEKTLDAYASALLVALFPLQTTIEPTYNCLHLASGHYWLTWLQNFLVIRDNIPISYYLIDGSGHGYTSACVPNAVQQYRERNSIAADSEHNTVWVGKFLPYLALVINARYYVNTHSDQTIGTLVKINYNSNDQIESVEMQMDSNHPDDERQPVRLYRTKCQAVMFDRHYNFIMTRDHDNILPGESFEKKPLDSHLGDLINFPIYPINFCTFHKVQGTTFSGEIDTNFRDGSPSYRGLYVAMSRVRDPSQMVRVCVQNQLVFLLSTIFNFPEYIDDPTHRPSVAELKRRLDNYTVFDRNPMYNELQFYDYVMRFWKSSTRDERRNYAAILRSTSLVQPVRLVPPVRIVAEANVQTLAFVLQHRPIMRALSRINRYDRFVWLHEWLVIHKKHPPVDEANAMRQVLDSFSAMENHLVREVLSMKPPPPEEPVRPNDASFLSELTYLYEANNYSSTVQFIVSRSFAHLRLPNETADKIEWQNQRCLHQISPSLLMLVGRPFLASVFARYREAHPITENWLVMQLNAMLVAVNSEPEPLPQEVTDGSTDAKKRPSKRRRVATAGKRDNGDGSPKESTPG